MTVMDLKYNVSGTCRRAGSDGVPAFVLVLTWPGSLGEGLGDGGGRVT